MAKITLINLRHSYLAEPRTRADYALQQIDAEWSGRQRFYIHGLVMGIQYAAVGWADHIHWLGILCLQMGLIKVATVLQAYDFESDGN